MRDLIETTIMKSLKASIKKLKYAVYCVMRL